MTLVSTVAPLVGYAIVFQTIVYLLIPARRRTLIAPVLTGVVGAVLTLGAGWIFGLEAIGLGAPDMAVVSAWAVATVLVMAVIGRVMLRSPELRSQLADPRLAALSPRQAFMQIVVRIPVMTALIEEAFFRGVLHAALIALYPPSVALVGGALLFGLWHVGPGLDQARATAKDWRRNALHVGITVLATSLAGAALVWLRMETGSIWVPVAVHAGINMTMAVYARIAASRQMAGVPTV
jgi:membrane protease YdiL (CAAX protease family)